MDQEEEEEEEEEGGEWMVMPRWTLDACVVSAQRRGFLRSAPQSRPCPLVGAFVGAPPAG
eukprot:8545255-Pyramimonas_sp.AAC.1